MRNPATVRGRRVAAPGRIGYAAGMRIEFVKMQGLGNDFLVFDAPAALAPAGPDAHLLRALADRHTGVGFDQALMLEPPRDAFSTVFYRVFNADGSEVEQCGNGARCVAALMHARAPQLGREMLLQSAGGTVRARIEEDGLVSVEMGVPDFTPTALPFAASAQAARYTLQVDGREFEIGAVSIGNPHAVLRVADVAHAPVAELGPLIESHARFAKRVNVGFMQVLDRGTMRLRVYERGVGETLACGTGACAAVAQARQWQLVDSQVRVELKGGNAQVSWGGARQPIWLTGPATTVFTGSIDLTRFTGATA